MRARRKPILFIVVFRAWYACIQLNAATKWEKKKKKAFTGFVVCVESFILNDSPGATRQISRFCFLCSRYANKMTKQMNGNFFFLFAQFILNKSEWRHCTLSFLINTIRTHRMCEWINIKCLIHKNKNTMTNKTHQLQQRAMQRDKQKKNKTRKKDSVPCDCMVYFFFIVSVHTEATYCSRFVYFLAAFYDSYGNKTYICCAYFFLFNEFCLCCTHMPFV